jgi:hypothetical protein
LFNNMTRKLLYIFCFLFGNSCSEGGAEYSLLTNHEATVDESSYVLGGISKSLKVINDSMALLLSMESMDDLLLYNYKTGRLIRKYAFNRINGDSLVNKFIIPNNPDRIFIMKGDSEYQNIPVPERKLFNFQYDPSTNTIITGYCCRVQYGYKDHPDRGYTINYACFLAYMDIEGKIKKCIPIQERIMDYYTAPVFQPNFCNGFFANEQMVFLNNYARRKGNEEPCLLKYNILGSKDSLSFEKPLKIYYPDTLLYFGGAAFQNAFFMKESDLFVSNQKMIYNIETGIAITRMELLQDSILDHILSFGFINSNSEQMVLYVLREDSADNYKNSFKYLRIWDSQQRIIYDPIILKDSKAVDFYNNKVIVLEEGKENYFFRTYELYKN